MQRKLYAPWQHRSHPFAKCAKGWGTRLQWFLEDESGREYGLSVLASLSSRRAAVPILWFYEVGNGLVMAHRRKRITLDQIDGFLTRLKALLIDAAQLAPGEILDLPALAQKHSLTNYDAAYLALAIHLNVSLATTGVATVPA